MFDPAHITFGQMSSTIRDFTIIGFLIGASWKARGWYELISNFFDRITKHMSMMEDGMEALLTNHLTHIEADLAEMSGRSQAKKVKTKKQD